jgi:glutamyl-tRNA reductase
MNLFALGLNHQSASIALRERVAFSSDIIGPAAADLSRQEGLYEAFIISTCNRTELYFTGESHAEQIAIEWLHRNRNVTSIRLDEYLYRFQNLEASKHLFRVATGVDSMILGESQILGQVKDAYHRCRSAGSLNTSLERLCQNAFAVAKHVRTHTQIGANPISVAFAAVRLAQQIFADLSDNTVLLVGAGDTIELTARHLKESKVERFIIANRSVDNARALTDRLGGMAIPLTELDRHLASADIIISSTASPHHVIHKNMIESALQRRRHKPMLIIDLAVPRDVAPEIEQLSDVFLYTIDNLANVIEDNLRTRRHAALEAEAIIRLHAEHYMAWWGARTHHEIIRKLRHDMQKNADILLSKANQQLAAGKSPSQALQFLAHTLTNRILHSPSANLRAAAMRGDQEWLKIAEQLFHDPNSENEPPSS